MYVRHNDVLFGVARDQGASAFTRCRVFMQKAGAWKKRTEKWSVITIWQRGAGEEALERSWWGKNQLSADEHLSISTCLKEFH